MKTTINALIDQYNTVEAETEKKAIKNQIHQEYYHASPQERSIARDRVQPFLDEIEQEMIAKDPIARQTYEMFKRLTASKSVVGQ